MVAAVDAGGAAELCGDGVAVGAELGGEEFGGVARRAEDLREGEQQEGAGR